MIILTDLNKCYGRHHVLRGINLSIKSGEIFAIIGKSGAGKSTLLRCINLLERPDHGMVSINGQDLMTHTPRKLREARHQIGMIFQQFNLLETKSVYENIALPLRIQGMPEAHITSRVMKLLDLVELHNKAKLYPASLSGGQKQRVAIARILSSSPRVLLCDEATSALDFDTTTTIITLLKKINYELGVTIVLVTHEMDVVKQLAHRVALMSGGQILDTIAPKTLFAKPTSPAKQLLCAQLSPKLPLCLLKNLSDTAGEQTKPLVRMFFQGEAVNGPILSQISRELHIKISLLLANIDEFDGVTCEVVILKLDANAEQLERFLLHCDRLNLIVETLGYVTHHAT